MHKAHSQTATRTRPSHQVNALSPIFSSLFSSFSQSPLPASQQTHHGSLLTPHTFPVLLAGWNCKCQDDDGQYHDDQHQQVPFLPLPPLYPFLGDSRSLSILISPRGAEGSKLIKYNMKTLNQKFSVPRRVAPSIAAPLFNAAGSSASMVFTAGNIPYFFWMGRGPLSRGWAKNSSRTGKNAE